MPVFQTGPREIERRQLIFRVAQELRFSSQWLSELALCDQEGDCSPPAGSVKAENVMLLMQTDFDLVTKSSHGEEKHLFQLTLQLGELGKALGSPRSRAEVKAFNKRSDWTIHDIHFLNNFLHWYLRPTISDHLTEHEIYSLGFDGFPGEFFQIRGVKRLDLKHFEHEGKPITRYGDYLGLID
jgi:hypothetical protein